MTLMTLAAIIVMMSGVLCLLKSNKKLDKLVSEPTLKLVLMKKVIKTMLMLSLVDPISVNVPDRRTAGVSRRHTCPFRGLCSTLLEESLLGAELELIMILIVYTAPQLL